MSISALNSAFVNALLADASYVNLKGNDNILLTGQDLTDALALRLTQPLAEFITQNFTIKTQEIAPSESFSAVVWEGKAGTDYASKVFLSMRGTADGADLVDDVGLAALGVPYDQLAEMVNWWLRETTPVGQHVTQLRVSGGLGYYFFEIDNSVNVQGTGHLTNISHIDSVNGHSLGGYLATSFERIFGSNVSIGQISTFNRLLKFTDTPSV
jgi:hypothetical protein